MDEPDNDLFSEVNWGKAERSQHGLTSEQDQRTPIQWQGSGSLEKAGRCIYNVSNVQLSVCRTTQNSDDQHNYKVSSVILQVI